MRGWWLVNVNEASQLLQFVFLLVSVLCNVRICKRSIMTLGRKREKGKLKGEPLMICFEMKYVKLHMIVSPRT